MPSDPMSSELGMGVATARPVAVVDELTPAWLSAALGYEVTAVDVVTVGTGQMGSCYRLDLAGDPALPASVLAKMPTTDAGMREFLAGMYGSEVRFYRDLADSVRVRVPRCHYAQIGENGVFTILMEDLAPAEPGDQVTGCRLDQARDAVVNLAGLHGPRWNDRTLVDRHGLALASADDAALLDATFPDATEQTMTMLGSLVADDDAALLRELAPSAGRWLLAGPDRFALVHGDYRLDNLLFAPDTPTVWAVDWQGLAVGLPARDLSFFLGTGLTVAHRREHERSLVGSYHARLVEFGVVDYSFEQCWDDYRFAMVHIPLIVMFGCAYGARSERGDRMFAAMLERGCAAIRDLGTLTMIG